MFPFSLDTPAGAGDLKLCHTSENTIFPCEKFTGAADNGDRADADLQQQLGQDDENRLSQHRADGFLLHDVDLLLQLGEIKSFLISVRRLPFSSLSQRASC